MKIKIPLAVLDLETTGTWIDKDKTIEIGILRCEPDGTQRVYESRVNPGMPIPLEVQEITGITDADVQGAPFFKNIAPDILEFLGGCDLAGFNLERFDLPLLEREMSEAGLKFEWQKRSIYDAQKIYHLHERRDLTAAYKFYCNKDLLGAHSALADTRATWEVIESQVKKYGGGSDDIESLRDFDYKKRDVFFDAERKFRWWNGELYMMFGKYARREHLRNIARKDRGYLEWMLTQNFSDEVKALVAEALQGRFPAQEQDSGKIDVNRSIG